MPISGEFHTFAFWNKVYKLSKNKYVDNDKEYWKETVKKKKKNEKKRKERKKYCTPFIFPIWHPRAVHVFWVDFHLFFLFTFLTWLLP